MAFSFNFAIPLQTEKDCNEDTRDDKEKVKNSDPLKKQGKLVVSIELVYVSLLLQNITSHIR